MRVIPAGIWLTALCTCSLVLAQPNGSQDQVKEVFSLSLMPRGLALSPDGKMLAGGWSQRQGYGIGVWEVPTGKEIYFAPYPGIASVQFTPDGTHLVVSGGEYGQVGGFIHFFDVRTWQARLVLEPPSPTPARLHPKGKVCATTGNFRAKDRSLIIWDVQTGKQRAHLKPAKGGAYVVSLEFSPDGTLLAAGEFDGMLRIWDWQAGKELAEYRISHGTPANWVLCLAFSPDGKRLAAISRKPDISVIYLQEKTVNVLKYAVCGDCAVFCPDGETLLAPPSGEFMAWNVTTGKLKAKIRLHRESIRYLALSPDGKYLATGASDGKIKVWKLEDVFFWAELQRPPAPESPRFLPPSPFPPTLDPVRPLPKGVQQAQLGGCCVSYWFTLQPSGLCP